MLRCAMQFFALQCFAMQFFTTQRHVMLWHTTLCCAPPSPAMPYSTMHRAPSRDHRPARHPT
eukprot:8178643-Pyramimonas_sp.AAC.1